MRFQSSLLLSGFLGLTTLLSPVPTNAFSVIEPGGINNIPAGGSPAFFNLDIDNTSGASLTVSNVTLSIASLVAGADLADIELYLSSPGGTYTLTLKDSGTNIGSSTYIDVNFTDASADKIDVASPDINNEITGAYKPEGTPGTSLTSNISDFAGFQSVVLSPGSNTWTLTAFNFDIDTTPASISSITLNVTPVPLETDAFPIAFSAVFLGTGLWLKRRKNGRK